MENPKRRKLILDPLSEFLAPFPHRTFAFTFKTATGEIYLRNRHWDTLGEAKQYCARHGIRFIETRSEDGIRWKTPIAFIDAKEFIEYVGVKKPSTIHAGMYYADGKNGNRKYEAANDLVRGPWRGDFDSKFFYWAKHILLITPRAVSVKKRALAVDCPCNVEKRCCNICWVEWVQPRISRLLHFLKNSLGWKQILLVYSGRRGVHVWAMDEEAFDLTTAQRTCIYQHLKQMDVKLDAAITIKPEHLCKVPMLPHAKSGQFAAPIDLDTWLDFRPEDVPTAETVTDQQLKRYGDILKKAKS